MPNEDRATHTGKLIVNLQDGSGKVQLAYEDQLIPLPFVTSIGIDAGGNVTIAMRVRAIDCDVSIPGPMAEQILAVQLEARKPRENE